MQVKLLINVMTKDLEVPRRGSVAMATIHVVMFG